MALQHGHKNKDASVLSIIFLVEMFKASTDATWDGQLTIMRASRERPRCIFQLVRRESFRAIKCIGIKEKKNKRNSILLIAFVGEPRQVGCHRRDK